ncbi:unnamed protein product [Cuscuta campestris]|uniref:Uncharacterized protein n=1 Tax=Cuscuta campestris TaxID=132261 RepID=A0A484KIR5_9ASTE|nr:unnamed protein product [Cuscuta campestris]
MHPVQSKTILDKFAAVEILQGYLDFVNRGERLKPPAASPTVASLEVVRLGVVQLVAVPLAQVDSAAALRHPEA